MTAAMASAAGCTLPSQDEAIYELEGDVSLRRDALGAVHVYGATDADVYYGSGFAQARDRLFQMDFIRRRALGRRAEIGGTRYVDDDRLVRMMGIASDADATEAKLRETSPAEYELLFAWTSGVNAFIDEVREGRAPLPAGFRELGHAPEPWAVRDGLAVGKLVLFGNANQIEFELLASLLRQYTPEVWERLPLFAPLESAFILPPAETSAPGGASSDVAPPPPPERAAWPPGSRAAMKRFAERWAQWQPGASNNWAVSGRHTANGRSLIAGDPHQPLRTPSVFWLHHLNSRDGGGTLDVAGFSFAGSPGIQLGHNRDLAWTATTTYPDVMDLVDVAYDGTTVTIAGERIAAEVTRETVLVRDAPAVDVEVVVVPGYGRLLPENLSPLPIASGRILLRWTGFGPTDEARGFFSMGAASDLDAYAAAVDRMEIANFNFIAATADDIVYRSSMAVPDRGPTAPDQPPYALLNGERVGPWGALDRSRLPRSGGEARGFLVSANNDPFGFTQGGAIADDPFYFGVFFDPGTRAARATSELERLVATGAVRREQMQELQRDTHSRPADLLVPILADALAAATTDPTLEAYRDRPDLAALTARLEAWDRRMDATSPEALVFHALLWFATSRTLRDDLSLAFSTIETASPIYLVKWALLTLTRGYPRADELMTEGRAAIVLAALDDTVRFLETRYGGIDGAYTWGDLHETHFRDLGVAAYDGPRFPSGGADGTIDVRSGSLFQGGDEPADTITSTSGAAYRMVAEFDETGRPQAWINFAPGNPGEPTDPGAFLGVDAWREGRYERLPFTEDEVDAATEEETVLSP
ncbi:MAG: penicillin acylase family protein [Myxococcota bacterium]